MNDYTTDGMIVKHKNGGCMGIFSTVSLLNDKEQELSTLRAQVTELESYRNDWREIAGKANLKGLMQRLEDADEVIGYYSKTETWTDKGRICNSDRWEPWGKQGIEVGGKRAREYQAKYKEAKC